MKPVSLKTFTEKISNILIITIVLAGTVTLAFVNQVAEEGSVMSKLFLVFLGAIVTFQVIPGLMLIGGMIKGLLGIGHKKEVHEESGTRQ
jgi:nitrate reductase gamma subunit